MHHHQVMRSVLFCGGLAAVMATGACNREEAAPPPAEVQSQAAQPANQPMTVAGCLKVGEASDTYVLTAERSEGSPESATYQLVGAPGVNLQEHVGQRVRASGTMEARQAKGTQTMATPADQERPAGTSGTSDTPAVQTRTDVAINRLSVDAVERLGERCN